MIACGFSGTDSAPPAPQWSQWKNTVALRSVTIRRAPPHREQ
jgi:hypothetical protein